MKAHKSRDVSIFSISGTQNSPGSSLLPCEAWEKVAEGRMRALSRSARGFQQHLLTGKEPSPALRAPSPILRTGEGECLEEARRLIHFPWTALRETGRGRDPTRSGGRVRGYLQILQEAPHLPIAPQWAPSSPRCAGRGKSGYPANPPAARKASSSGVDFRPRMALRWGKRPKRAMISR